MSARPTRARVVLVLAAKCLSGGSVYMAVRVMVEDGIPALLGTGVRFAVAGLALLLLLAASGRRIRIARRELAASAALGLFQVAFANGAIALASRDLTSSLTALLVSSVTLWVIVLRWAVLRERIEAGVMLGVAVGVAGIAVLVVPGQATGASSAIGVAFALVGPMAGAACLLTVPRAPLPRDLLVAAGWQMACGGGFLLLVALALGDGGSVHVAAIPGEAWLALAHLVVVGSWVMFGSYLWLARNVPPSQAAMSAYVVPFVAVTLGWLVLDEPVTGATVLGGALIVAAVALTVRRPRARIRAHHVGRELVLDGDPER